MLTSRRPAYRGSQGLIMPPRSRTCFPMKPCTMAHRASLRQLWGNRDGEHQRYRRGSHHPRHCVGRRLCSECNPQPLAFLSDVSCLRYSRAEHIICSWHRQPPSVYVSRGVGENTVFVGIPLGRTSPGFVEEADFLWFRGSIFLDQFQHVLLLSSLRHYAKLVTVHGCRL